MGASWEQVGGLGRGDLIAFFFQKRHIPGKGCRVTGYIDDPLGLHFCHSRNGVGIQTLPGRVYHHHIRNDSLLLQFQRRLACVTAEKLRIFNAVAAGVFPGIQNGLLYHLDTNDFAGGLCHGQGDGAYAAIKIQHQILFGDPGLPDGGFVKPLGLMVIHLIERPGRKPEL